MLRRYPHLAPSGWIAVAAAALTACDPPPIGAPITLPGDSLECKHTERGDVTIAVCDLSGAPQTLGEFLQMRRLPPREAKLRAKMYQEGSVLEPIEDENRDLPGWLFSEPHMRYSMLVAATAPGAGIVLTQLNSPDTGPLMSVLASIASQDDAHTVFSKLTAP